MKNDRIKQCNIHNETGFKTQLTALTPQQTVGHIYIILLRLLL